MFEIKCKVNNGRIPDATRKAIAAEIAKYNDKVIVIEVKEAKKKRSCKQNRYYWGVIIPSMMALFNDAWDNNLNELQLHEVLKKNVGNITKAIALPEGGYDIVTKSSTELTTAEFEQYNERCRVYAAQNGVAIPLPNEIIMDE